MTADNSHPLLIRGAQLTEKVWTWTLKEHPHTVAGSCRGFEVRVYHHPAEGWDPYFIAMVSTKEGWVMDSTHATTAEAAESNAREMFDELAQRQPRTFTAADLDRMTDYKDRVERLTHSLLAAIGAAGATPAASETCPDARSRQNHWLVQPPKRNRPSRRRFASGPCDCWRRRGRRRPGQK
jgi:hypothetical protein